MMRKLSLNTLLLSSLFISGCSSYPEHAEEVAQAVCHAFKAADFDSMKHYMSEETLKERKKHTEFVSKFFASTEYQEMAKETDCSHMTQQKNYDDGRKKIYFGKFKVKLKKIDDEWRIVE